MKKGTKKFFSVSFFINKVQNKLLKKLLYVGIIIQKIKIGIDINERYYNLFNKAC